MNEKRYIVKRNAAINRYQNFVEEIVNSDGSNYSLHPLFCEKKIIKTAREEINEECTEILKPLFEDIPDSNGTHYYEKYNIKVGIVADQDAMNIYKGVVDAVYVTPGNYRGVINEIDILLITSQGRGLRYSEWRFGLGEDEIDAKNNIEKLITIAKEKEKPVLFYLKEDIDAYEYYAEAIKLCDYFFTAESSYVEKYKETGANENINVLEAGINPLIHNPIGMKKCEKEKKIIFSGSWIRSARVRMNSLRTLLEGVRNSEYELQIMDYDFETLGRRRTKFPKEFKENIRPCISNDYLLKLYKTCDWALNINAIENGHTMFSNRCYELLANGNLVISNYNLGVNSKLPNVFMAYEAEDVLDLLNAYSDEEIYERQIAGIRSVMTEHTVFSRIKHMFDTIDYPVELTERKVLVVADELTDHIQNMFACQTYKNCELIAAESFTAEKMKEADMIAFFSDENEYEMFYLEDMVNAFKYTAADYVTKDAYYSQGELVQGIEHDYVSVLKDKYCTLFWAKSFTYETLMGLQTPCDMSNGYSIDHFHYSAGKPVWKEFENKDYKISVVIPIYNNGKHLYGKCFSSLRRSSMFENMEIIMVDDGSNDGFTSNMVNYIDHRYSNVRTFFFNDGGSGSASRPRNKGVELAAADYIAFLDPDNEAIGDGYAKLYSINEEKKRRYDFIIGDTVVSKNKVQNWSQMPMFDAIIDNDELKAVNEEYLIASGFKPINIQAGLIRKALVEKYNMTQVVGAAGQDSLFSWQLILYSDCVRVVRQRVKVYYAGVQGSVVNSLGKRFFDRYYKIEGPRYEFLKNSGTLEAYMATRFREYFITWYLNKLPLVRENELEYCIDLLKSIFDIYADDYKNNDDMLDTFLLLQKEGRYQDLMEYLKNELPEKCREIAFIRKERMEVKKN